MRRSPHLLYKTERASDSEIDVTWTSFGHPNTAAEPGIQWVGFRTSRTIWNEPVVRLSCKNGKGAYKNLSFIGGSFPSRKLYVNGVMERNVDQRAFSELWFEHSKRKGFVRQ